MLVDAQKQIAADQPWIFFEHYKWYMPMTKGLTGYKITALWYWDAFIHAGLEAGVAAPYVSSAPSPGVGCRGG